MGWSFQSNLPVYLQIASTIRNDIIRGKYTRNTQIPTVRQLAFDAAVNPNTIQRALAHLEQEGLLVTKGTIGRFVTDDSQILENARRMVADDLLTTFIEGCKQIGFSKEEMIQLIDDKEEK